MRPVNLLAAGRPSARLMKPPAVPALGPHGWTDLVWDVSTESTAATRIVRKGERKGESVPLTTGQMWGTQGWIVMLALARFNDEGRWPNLEQMSARIGMSISQTRLYLRGLVKTGHVQIMWAGRSALFHVRIDLTDRPAEGVHDAPLD